MIWSPSGSESCSTSNLLFVLLNPVDPNTPEVFNNVNIYVSVLITILQSCKAHCQGKLDKGHIRTFCIICATFLYDFLYDFKMKVFVVVCLFDNNFGPQNRTKSHKASSAIFQVDIFILLSLVLRTLPPINIYYKRADISEVLLGSFHKWWEILF